MSAEIRLAEEILSSLTHRGETLALAESLTGGAISSVITSIPGASHVLLGCLVTYSPRSKIDLLGIDRDLLETHGLVSREVAETMALAARTKLGATWGVSTTGVAGPGAHQGIPAGKVWLAVSGPQSGSDLLELGDLGREIVRNATVTAALALLSRILRAS